MLRSAATGWLSHAYLFIVNRHLLFSNLAQKASVTRTTMTRRTPTPMRTKTQVGLKSWWGFVFLYFYLVLGNLHWFQHLEIENFFAIFVLDTHAVPAYRGQTLFTLLTNKVLSWLHWTRMFAPSDPLTVWTVDHLALLSIGLSDHLDNLEYWPSHWKPNVQCPPDYCDSQTLWLPD